MTPEQTATPAGTVVRAGGPARTTAPRDLPSVAAPEEFSFRVAPARTTAPTTAQAPAARRVPLGPLWAATALATGVLTAFFVLIVSGRVVTEGPVVAVLTSAHGIHAGDLLALAAWCLAVGALAGAATATSVAVRRR